jgi:transcriptional regulator with XRE-family HTH domain
MATRKKPTIRSGRPEEQRVFSGERLRLLREARGWSQQEFSFKARLTANQPSLFENGRSDPSLATYVRIVSAFGCDWGYLLGMSDKP